MSDNGFNRKFLYFLCRPLCKIHYQYGEMNLIRKWNLIKDQGFDLTFKRMWEFYLSYCEAGFKSKEY